MAAWDNVSLPSAPAAPSYMAPNLSAFLQQSIGNLPSDYYQGQQQQAQLQFLRNLNQFLQPGGGAGGGSPVPDPYANPNSASAANSNAAGPSNNTQPLAGNPQLGSDNSGANSVNSLASEVFGDKDASALNIGGRTINAVQMVAQRLGVDQGAPLSPEQSAQAKQLYQRLASAQGGNVAPTGFTGVGSEGSTTGSTGGDQPATSSEAPPRGNGQTAASGLGGETSPPEAQGRTPSGTASPGQGSTSAAAALVPPQYRNDPRAFVQRLDDTIRQLSDRVSQQEKGPKIKMGPLEIDTTKTEGLKAKIDEYKSLRDKVLDAIKQENEPTGEQKNARDSAILQRKGQEEVQAGDIKRGQATFNGLSAAARQYETDLKPYLDLTRSIINDPRAYTGAGSQMSLNLNRVRAAFGDQGAATLQEMLTKVRAQTVLNTINTQKDEMMEAGGNSGRMFAQQVAQVEKAVPGLETSLGGNRALVEIATRVGDHQSQVAQMARDYIATQKRAGGSGYLDQGFDDQLSKYMRSHPLFSKQEMAHPELLGAPTMPATIGSKEQLSAWGKSLGLNPGDPFRTASGQVRALP